VRVFKAKWFARHAMKEGIEDCKLIEAIREIENGLIDADYGGGLIKKRIARDGGGKSGGYRSIIAYKSESRCVFLYFYAKSERENLNVKEVNVYKSAASIYLGFTDIELALALEKKEIEEVLCDDKKIQKPVAGGAA